MTKKIHHSWEGHYMEPAFLGFVSWAAKDLVGQYLEETGESLGLASSTINRMIDEATGNDADREIAQRFVKWCEVQFGTPEQVGVA